MDFLDLPTVSYAHENGRDSNIRFRQYEKDPLPPWAVDVQPDQTDRQRMASEELCGATNASCAEAKIEGKWGLSDIGLTSEELQDKYQALNLSSIQRDDRFTD